MTRETECEIEQLPAIDRPVVMFVINNAYASASSSTDVYDATRGNWRIGAASRELAEVALGIVDGVVRSAFEIDGWRPAGDGGEVSSNINDDARWCFEGRETSQTRSWIGRSVRHLAPAKGAANPVRLFLEGVPGAAATIQSAVAVLENEPLARIMFGNGELFHSNFLAWIFERFPAEADAVFGSLVRRHGPSHDERKVERERENLDLVMNWVDRASLVIENKVFAVPHPDQLDRYAEKMAKWKNPVGAAVVLSPGRPRFLRDGYRTEFAYRDGSPIEWQHMSFEMLADALDSAFAASPTDYEVETVRRYGRILRALAAVLATTNVSDRNESAFGLAFEALHGQPKQLTTGLAKARAERVAESLEELLRDSGLEVQKIESGLDRGQPRLSWYRTVETSGEFFTAGWQYQEGNLRLVVVLKHLAGRGSQAKILRRDFGLKHPELFAFAHLDEILATGEVPVSLNTKPEGPFGHFDPDFIYRQKVARELTVEQLFQLTLAQSEHLDRLTARRQDLP